MQIEYRGQGVVLYQKEQCDYEQEALRELARRSVAGLSDQAAIGLEALFPAWRIGSDYSTGQRVSDGGGSLYRVVQDHTAQEDWPMESTPALYTPLGVTAEDPEGVPEWRQPQGAHDAYHVGDRVRYGGKVYVSTADGNVWVPGVTGWAEAGQ